MVEKIRRRVTMQWGEYVEPEGIGSGKALWWNDDVQMMVKRKESHMISIEIIDCNNG